MWNLQALLPLVVAVALAGAAALEFRARRQAEARLRREVAALREAARRDHEALEALRSEVAALRGGTGAPPAGGPSETRMVKGLVAKLRAQRDRRRDPGARPAVDPAIDPSVDPAAGPDAPLPSLSATPEAFDRPAITPGRDEAAILRAVREALTHDRTELVLQPVVSLPQRRRRFYECTTRIRDAAGGYLTPEDYLEVAERAGLAAAVDNMLLFRCIQLVRSLQRRHEAVDFFCNVSAATLRDDLFFADFVDYLAQHPDPAAHLVFEVSHADLDAQGPRARALLERLQALGCRLSVDASEPERLDPAGLAARGVGFVKLEAGRLLAFAQRHGPGEAAALVRRISDAGLVGIVEKVEDEESLRELLDFGIDYGQGDLFGEPRPARSAA